MAQRVGRGIVTLVTVVASIVIRSGTHCTGGWLRPSASLDGRKTSPHRDSIPGPSSPYSVAIPTELPGPLLQMGGTINYGPNSSRILRI